MKKIKILLLLIICILLVAVLLSKNKRHHDNNVEKVIEADVSAVAESPRLGETPSQMSEKEPAVTNNIAVLDNDKIIATSPEVEEHHQTPQETVSNSVGGFVAEPNQSVDSVVSYIVDMKNNDRQNVAINELPGKKNSLEIKVLSDFLKTPLGDHAVYSREYGIRNAIMDVLREQTDESSYVISVFVQMYENPAQGDVMQGYALQHLASTYIDSPTTLSLDNKTRIVENLYDALQYNQEGTLASTGLIGLQNISQSDSSLVSQQDVLKEAHALLNNEQTGFLAEMSALQVCGKQKDNSFVNRAEQNALDSDCNLGVRLASIYLLGQTEGNEAILETLKNNQNNMVRNAAVTAIKKGLSAD